MKIIIIFTILWLHSEGICGEFEVVPGCVPKENVFSRQASRNFEPVNQNSRDSEGLKIESLPTIDVEWPEVEGNKQKATPCCVLL